MRSRAIWMLGLALVLAVAAVFLAQNWLQKQTKPDVAAKPDVATVVVARTALDFGAIIRKEHLRTIAWPSGSLPKGAFRSIGDVVGDRDHRVALRRIEINEPVLKSKVSGFGGRASLSAVISQNMRAATIRVNDVNGVGGFVLPGDRVDVLLTRDPVTGKRGGTRNLMTDILLQNVKVLALDQNSNENKEKPSVAKSATLEVTPRQAQKLVLAQQVGTLSLALRNVNNVAAEAARTVRLRDLRVGEVNGAARNANNTPVASRKAASRKAASPKAASPKPASPKAASRKAASRKAASRKKAAKTPVKKRKTTVKIVRGLERCEVVESCEVEVIREQPAIIRSGFSEPPIARPKGPTPEANHKGREVRIDRPPRPVRSEPRSPAVSITMLRRPARPEAPFLGQAAMSEPSARPGPTPR